MKTIKCELSKGILGIKAKFFLLTVYYNVTACDLVFYFQKL